MQITNRIEAKVSDHQGYYLKNNDYSKFLDAQDSSTFNKYATYLSAKVPAGGRILDVGCGAGSALALLRGNYIAEGVEVSETSVVKCQEKQLKCEQYDGSTLPFKDGELDAVGSYNVLEHTDDPTQFLNEKLRVLREGGIFVVACPNFLSITNSYHWHTSGLAQKGKNVAGTLARIVSPKTTISPMKTVEREIFQADDDACNVTNPLDILHWAKLHKLKLLYASSQSVHLDGGVKKFLDFYPLSLFFGACFFVFEKPLEATRKNENPRQEAN